MAEQIEQQIEENLNDFVKLIDEGDLVRDSGVENIIGNLNNSAYLLPEDKPLHEFPLSGLRRFPRYLCDAILKPHTTVVTLDNHLFWGWTASYVSHRVSRNDDLEEMRSLLSDFYSLVHLCLLPARQNLLDNRVSQFISSMNQSIEGVQHQGFSLACSTGFSLLEGFIKRHCDDLELDGSLVNGPIEDPSWRYTSVDEPQYHDKLQIWKERQASEEVAATLRKIDNLDRYPMEDLGRKIQKGEISVEIWDNFLSIFSDQRNANIHGEISTQVVGPIVLNLCCLVLWDMVEEKEFESSREEVLEALERYSKMPTMGGHPQGPSAFYPL